jgi:hypothetical protein
MHVKCQIISLTALNIVPLFIMADRVGFEPTERLHVLRISNPALSATQPPVLTISYYNLLYTQCQ